MHEKSYQFGSKTGTVKVCGFDWLPRGEIQEAFTRLPADADILITHQVWDEFMQGLGRIECTLPDVHHARVILNGDFHPTKIADWNWRTGAADPHAQSRLDLHAGLQRVAREVFFVVGLDNQNQIVFEPQKLETRNFSISRCAIKKRSMRCAPAAWLKRSTRCPPNRSRLTSRLRASSSTSICRTRSCG
jgi:hypothetical protein